MTENEQKIEKVEEENKNYLPCGCEVNKCKCELSDIDYIKKYGSRLVGSMQNFGIKNLYKQARAKMKADKEYAKKLKQESKNIIKEKKKEQKESKN